MLNKIVYILVNICLIIGSTESYAQYENVWAFGEGAGLDFNQNSPVAISTAINTNEGTAAISDANGRLLFYTDGTTVWDRNDQVMPNGGNITNTFYFPVITWSTAQAAQIIPVPGEPDQYYVFSLGCYSCGEYAGKLYYNIVDMRLNNGLGDVLTGGPDTLSDGGRLTEHMTAVAGDACNVWLLVIERYTMTLKAYNIDLNGVNTTPVNSSLTANVGANSEIGVMDVSPDRNRLAVAVNNLAVYDFDPGTGTVSNPILLHAWNGSGLLRYYGVCFSPDNSKLYASVSSAQGGLHQFDLSPSTIDSVIASKIDIAAGAFLSRAKRGPDGKLYVSLASPENREAISIIPYPNLSGMACGYMENALPLVHGSRTTISLPNTVVAVTPKDTFLSAQPVFAPCFTKQVVISAQDTAGGWAYLWNTNASSSEISIDSPGTYWVRYYSAPCTYHVDTFQVSFPHGVLPTISTQAACRSDNNGFAYAATYVGDPVDYNYVWIRGTDTLSVTDTLRQVPSGDYSLYVRTNTGCDTLLLFDIGMEDFRVSFEVSDTLICLGDTLQLTNTSHAHFSTYHWTFGNGDTTDLPDPPAYVYPESGAYKLMLAGTGEICMDTAYQTIIVDQPPVPQFTVKPKAICVGQPVYFSPLIDSTTIQLAWDMEAQLRVEHTIQTRYQHGFASSGTFPVRLSIKSRACPDTSVTDSIQVYPFPEVDLGGDSSICLNGQPVYLKNLRNAPLSAYHQVWSTGDTTEILKVVHPGTYTLSVTTEPIGCTTTESVTIAKDCYIDIPNAFTPNGDGNNDYFLPRQLLAKDLTRFKMQIFNRWGQLLFETNRLDGRGWDGRFNNQAQPMGVYLYRIEADFRNDLREKYEGNVTLVR